MQTVSIEQILDRSAELSSLPESVYLLNELMQKESVNISEISEVVSSDPILSARILKTVNSPFYGFPSSIDTIAYAVTILGIDSIRYLAVTSTVINHFSRNLNSVIPLDPFWRHSFATAVIAEQLARSIHMDHAERMFTCGLLHELGGLLMGMSAPELYKQAISLANSKQLKLEQAETDVFGFNHLDITAELLKMWQLPHTIPDAIQAMHNNFASAVNPQDSALLSISDAVATAIFPSIRLVNQELNLDSTTMNTAGVRPGQLNQILDELDNLVENAMDGLFSEMAAA